MKTALALVLALSCDGCITCLPPTTTVEVVDSMPDGARKVGFGVPVQWDGGSGGDCRTPPDEIVTRAERVGAEFMVIEHHAGWGLGAGKTICRARLYASSDTKPISCH